MVIRLQFWPACRCAIPATRLVIHTLKQGSSTPWSCKSLRLPNYSATLDHAKTRNDQDHPICIHFWKLGLEKQGWVHRTAFEKTSAVGIFLRPAQVMICAVVMGMASMEAAARLLVIFGRLRTCWRRLKTWYGIEEIWWNLMNICGLTRRFLDTIDVGSSKKFVATSAVPLQVISQWVPEGWCSSGTKAWK